MPSLSNGKNQVTPMMFTGSSSEGWTMVGKRTRRSEKTEDSNRFWPGQTPSAKNVSPRSQAGTEVSHKSAKTGLSPF